MKIKINSLFIFFFTLLLISCSTKIVKQETQNKIDTNKTVPVKIPKIKNIPESNQQQKILLGIDILQNRNFNILINKRVGLITNQTGVNSNLKSTIDILNEAPNVDLVALFGPEHGVRGDIEAGKYVEFYKDKETNLPVYSLYGKTRKPSKKMLKNIDVLVYDIQDIGVRSYTFISTMGLAMEAASEEGIEFVVLDRPNPLGGQKIEGNLVEKKFRSFISAFPIPYVYGLTVGELAKLLVAEKMVETNKNFKLTVVTMGNWKREMTFEETGLQWVPTSPHIPHIFSPYFYPMTGILGELRSIISIGVGYTLPFQIVGTEWIDGIKFAEKLNKMKIPGLFFRPITFKPYYAFGKGKTLHGVQIHILNYSKVNLTKTQFYIISAIQQLYPEKNIFQSVNKNQVEMFNKGIGTDKIYKMILEKENIKNILNYLDKDTQKFRKMSQKYLLYN